MVELVTSVDSALGRVERALPNDFPAHTWESISTGMRSEAKRFLRECGLL
jgi:serine/threonine-protein kinase HipA